MADVIDRIPPRDSELRKASWNPAEMYVGHAIAIRFVRHGPRAHDAASAVAAYRERIVARLERVQNVEQLEQAIQDIRQGSLG